MDFQKRCIKLDTFIEELLCVRFWAGADSLKVNPIYCQTLTSSVSMEKRLVSCPLLNSNSYGEETHK